MALGCPRIPAIHSSSRSSRIAGYIPMINIDYRTNNNVVINHQLSQQYLVSVNHQLFSPSMNRQNPTQHPPWLQVAGPILSDNWTIQRKQRA